MKIGFLGVGAIAEAMIIGLCTAGKFEGEVILSPRSVSRSNALASRFANVEVASTNQELVDRCDLLFLAVLPDQFQACMSELDFRSEMKLVSLVAGFSVGEIAELASPATSVWRIIPLPPVEHGLGAIPLYPRDAEIEKLLSSIGDVVHIKDEKEFLAFTTASSMMATFFEFASSVASWMESRGVGREQAAVYSSSTFQALARLAGDAPPESFHELADECLTAGGLNEQVLFELRDAGWFGQIDNRLDRIAARLEKWAEEMARAKEAGRE
ncbi:MAG: NAD(P)-binding domain-containing protein [Planctomycetota bacterium]